jgi:hypothetical protein
MLGDALWRMHGSGAHYNECCSKLYGFHPHTVYMYVADDYANTSCPVLQNWASNMNSNGPNFFSDATIDMADYTTIGMPK